MTATHLKGSVRSDSAATAPLRTATTVRRPAAVRRPPARRGMGPVAIGILVVLGLWAVGATGFAISSRLAVSRLADEQTDLRLAYEEKNRLLLRRLVGVQSHSSLEQDGLSDRLADIISRQVELENRQSTLTMMAERLGTSVSAGGAPAAAPAARPAEPRVAPVEPPTLKLGAPGPREPEPVPGRRSSLDDDPGPRGAAARSLQAAASKPLREQFAALESSIGRLEGSQTRFVGSLSAGVQNAIGTIRTALAALSLNVGPAPEEKKVLRLAARRHADPFDVRVEALEADFGQLQRWKAVADAVPLRRPVDGVDNLTSNFGTRKDPFTGATAMHAGMDFRGPIGTPIHASASGRVITADVSSGYGNLVEIEHGNGIVTRYGHLSAINVASGQSVVPGMVVGLLGSTGRSTGPHLHYETRINGGAVDPVRFLQAGTHLYDQPSPAEGATSPDPSDDAAFD